MAKKPYFRDRLIEDRLEGFVVIVPVEVEPPVPLGCPVCSHVMRSREDESAYRDLGCCDRCLRLWAAARRKQWVAGWRPTAEQVAAAEAERVPLALVFRPD